MKRLWMIVLMLSACLALGTSALAKNNHADKHDKDRDQVKRHDRDRDDHKARRGDRDDDDRNKDRDDHTAWSRRGHGNKDDKDRDVFVSRHGRRPPGWDHGRKVGWGGCNVPPGQAKKMGCQDRARHREPEHRIEVHTKPVIVRRPIVRRPTARVTAEGRATATVN